jgi:anti-sigma28 factor (negative regulator of flagellin synthesis)
MVGILGIGGVPELANTTPAAVREKRDDLEKGLVRDDVLISQQALDASRITRTSGSSAPNAEELQAQRVAQAKQNIEKGAYRVQQVVRQVAARISRFVIVEAG